MTPRHLDLALGEPEPDALAVARFSGTEHVGRPFRFAVTFGADPTGVGSPAALRGAPARLPDGAVERRRPEWRDKYSGCSAPVLTEIDPAWLTCG